MNERPHNQRLQSLDALRGLTVAAMLLVNNPGTWSAIYPPLEHAPWDGCTIADLVFPFFLFCVGASMAISFPRARERGTTSARIVMRAVSRGALLILVGLLLNALPGLLSMSLGEVVLGTRQDTMPQGVLLENVAHGSSPFAFLEHLRFLGVLQRIGLVVMLVAPIVVVDRLRLILPTAAIILVGYALFIGAAPISPSDNFAATFDRWLIPTAHLYRGGPFDPEGLTSTLPAAASALIGYALVRSLRRGELSAVAMAMVGVVLVGVAVPLHVWVTPVNKALWTSSYVLLTSGGACVLFGWLHALLDDAARRPGLLVRGAVHIWRVFGTNAIFAFVATGVVGRLLAFVQVRVSDGSTLPLQRFLYSQGFAPYFSPQNASLAYALVTVFVWYIIMAWMYHKQWFWRI